MIRILSSGESGGAPAPILVTLSNIRPTKLDVSWNNPNGASLFRVIKRVSGVPTLVVETSGSSIADVTVTASTSWTIEVWSNAGYGQATVTTPAPTILANVPWRFWGENMSFGTDGASNLTELNNGGNWYWPLNSGSPQPATTTTSLRNDEPTTITAARSLVASIAATPNPILAIGYRGGSWSVDSSVPTPAGTGGVIAGDTTPTPAVALSDEVTLVSGIAPAANLPVNITHGAGGTLSVLENTIRFGGAASDIYKVHQSGQFSADGWQVGNLAGQDVSTVLDIGPRHSVSHILTRHASGSFFNVALIGDSTTAQRRPDADSFAKSREGVVYRANLDAIAAGSSLRLVSFGQDSAKSIDMLHRLDALADLIAPYCGLALCQIATANQAFVSLADAQARWTAYVAVRDAVQARTGMVVRALMLNPAPGFSQSSENIAGYSYIMSQIAAEGGVDVSDLVISGTQLNPTYSQDGGHLNQAGIDAQHMALYTRTRSCVLSLGGDV